MFFTALKSIIGETIPEGYEPFALSRPEETVDSFIAPGAVLNLGPYVVIHNKKFF